jgi:hypothetical protein
LLRKCFGRAALLQHSDQICLAPLITFHLREQHVFACYTCSLVLHMTKRSFTAHELFKEAVRFTCTAALSSQEMTLFPGLALELCHYMSWHEMI